MHGLKVIYDIYRLLCFNFSLFLSTNIRVIENVTSDGISGVIDKTDGDGDQIIDGDCAGVDDDCGVCGAALITELSRILLVFVLLVFLLLTLDVAGRCKLVRVGNNEDGFFTVKNSPRQNTLHFKVYLAVTKTQILERFNISIKQ